MTSPNNLANTPLSQQVVQITSVDPVGGTATAITRQGSTVSINITYHVGAVHVIPCVNEQWVVKKVGVSWGLDRKLPKNDNSLANVVNNPVQGLTQIGSSGTGSGPTIIEGSQATINSNLLQLGSSTLYRDSGGTLQYSIDGGTTWTDVSSGGSGGGGPVTWASITGKPTDFPTTWDDVDGVPTTFPSDWSTLSDIPADFPTTWVLVSGKPATYPPTLPTGTPTPENFWCGDGTWKTPAGGAGPTEISVDNTPSGAINGSNLIFTLPAFTLGTTMVYLNGMRQKLGSDYTETNDTTITFATAPQTGDTLGADFIVAGGEESMVTGEVPTGTLNGSNATFTTANSYVSATTSVFRNGLREVLNSGYTESGGNAIVFSNPPLPTDSLVVDYLIPA